MRVRRRLERNRRWGQEPSQSERVERTEAEKARRASRDWLRTDVTEWDEPESTDDYGLSMRKVRIAER